MASKIEKLADDLMNLTKDEAQQLQLIIKAKIMPEVERQRGLLNDQMSRNPQLMNMGRQQQMAPRAAKAYAKKSGKKMKKMKGY